MRGLDGGRELAGIKGGEWESNELGFVTHVPVMLEFQHH